MIDLPVGAEQRCPGLGIQHPVDAELDRLGVEILPIVKLDVLAELCLLYTSPSPRD